ncbi:organic hydroperoxide resistance protein [Saccharopolyspora shandongensis]|uniref:organic hydroperoxide resistance protein n=1 Tax=Saccharopolyspora shandongensis TaxID=418495 RepID=UPI0033F1D1CD
MTVLYTAEATATGAGRDGRTRSSDGVLDLDLAVPKEMGGPGGAATNPEQLFAAGYAACFHGALQVVARRAKTDINDSSVTAEVGIGRNDAGGFGLSVALVVDLPGLPREQAQELVAAADQVCPYSNAIRGNVEIELRVA